jgi:hypothetical protein
MQKKEEPSSAARRKLPVETVFRLNCPLAARSAFVF